jgi:hypothetical protein
MTIDVVFPLITALSSFSGASIPLVSRSTGSACPQLFLLSATIVGSTGLRGSVEETPLTKTSRFWRAFWHALGRATSIQYRKKTNKQNSEKVEQLYFRTVSFCDLNILFFNLILKT